MFVKRFMNYAIKLLIMLIFIGQTAGCVFSSDKNNKGGADNSNTDNTATAPSAYTYKFSESTAAFSVWTTPAANKVKTTDSIPGNISSGISICAAKGEFEPFIVVLDKGSGTVTVSMDKFSGLGDTQRVELAKAGFESGWAEPLTPFTSGTDVTLSSNEWTPVWVTVYVPRDAAAGKYTTAVTLVHSSGTMSIPVSLKVFNFAIPEDLHFSSQFNRGITGEADHNVLYEHRLTPNSATWPSGFSYNITWKSPYLSFYDEADQGADYGIKYLAAKYIKGTGWRGSGYSTAMAFQFVDNSTPRPATFAGIARGTDHYGTAAYNTEWKKYLTALDDYLYTNGYTDEVYYYVMNEPQNQADYDLAAYLCKMTREASPHLKIAVSEEPKSEIAENTTYPSGGKSYDIWIAEVQQYKQGYAWQRFTSYGEIVWFYSLPQDPEPYFNPTKPDNSGMNQRIIPWCSWYHRARGWVYYDGGSFYDNGKPNIRLELLREGFEDYEYLYMANGNSHPVPGTVHPIDRLVNSVTTGLTSWTKDADAMMKLKWELGEYIEGSRTEIPVLEVSITRPRGEYYVNFQNPAGQPAANPLVIDGKTYYKVGWQAYNTTDHYGFSGYAITNPAVQKYGYSTATGFSEAQKSYLYDDYGKINMFEFDIESGAYNVTVGIGRPNQPASDKQHVVVEGVTYYDYAANLPSSEKTERVTVSDGKLSITFGDAVGQYTFMAYIKIVPAD